MKLFNQEHVSFIYNEESFEATRRKVPETSNMFVGTSVRRHPFSETIIETPLPKNWKNLTKDKYDGSTDPDEHIAVYTTQISRIHGMMSFCVECFQQP